MDGLAIEPVPPVGVPVLESAEGAVAGPAVVGTLAFPLDWAFNAADEVAAVVEGPPVGLGGTDEGAEGGPTFFSPPVVFGVEEEEAEGGRMFLPLPFPTAGAVAPKVEGAPAADVIPVAAAAVVVVAPSSPTGTFFLRGLGLGFGLSVALDSSPAAPSFLSAVAAPAAPVVFAPAAFFLGFLGVVDVVAVVVGGATATDALLPLPLPLPRPSPGGGMMGGGSRSGPALASLGTGSETLSRNFRPPPGLLPSCCEPLRELSGPSLSPSDRLDESDCDPSDWVRPPRE